MRLRALIIDDSTFMRLMLMNALKRLDWAQFGFLAPPEPGGEESVASSLVGACTEAVEATLATICGATPKCAPIRPNTTPCGAMVAVVSFFGAVPWSFSLVLPRSTAAALAEKFAGW